MSTELFPFAVWLAGTNQNSIPANDNALRNEVLAKGAISILDAEPSESDVSDGDVHIVGVPWGGFGGDDVVIYRGGTWYGFRPFEGWLKRLLSTGDLLGYDGSDGWTAQLSPGGGGDAAQVSYDNVASGLAATNVQDAIDELAATAGGLVAVNTQAGVSYMLVIADTGRAVRTTNAGEITITVPATASEAIPVGATIAIRQAGNGQAVLDVESDVTLNVPDGFVAATARYGSTIMLHKIGTDEWDLTGDLAEVASS